MSLEIQAVFARFAEISAKLRAYESQANKRQEQVDKLEASYRVVLAQRDQARAELAHGHNVVAMLLKQPDVAELEALRSRVVGAEQDRDQALAAVAAGAKRIRELEAWSEALKSCKQSAPWGAPS